ncbi:plastocyanin/azurin family copper-binding protein [Prosthecobacter sp.]|uniref:plastocyanin/azurin family copper-binding protein n=1 Tax=Prosthecobacter sp. TaxID=1965333 RepID=UPI003783AE4D
MSAHPSSSEKPSSIWSLLNVIIGTVIGGVVFLWVLAFVWDGLGSLRPKAKAEPTPAAAAAPALAAAPQAVSTATAALPTPAAPAAAPAIPAAATAPASALPVLEITLKPDSPSGMAYDVKAIVAKAGQKVKLTFNNTHPVPLPHNVVVGKAGTKDKMPAIATTGMTQPDKGFIPDSPDILAHTKLLQSGQSETIEFTLPTAGEYPYFCTFPGHFMLMNGTITAQ